MLKIGLFGAGQSGKTHLTELISLNNIAEVTGVYDPDFLAARSISSQFNIPSFQSAGELLTVCEAAVITVAVAQRFELCKIAIRMGKHVFVKCPMANAIEEARILLQLAEEGNIKFQVEHAERFNPAFCILKEYPPQPMFIEAQRLATFDLCSTDANIILDLMMPDIDIALSLVRCGISRIAANAVAVISDAPDIANARLEFHNGCVGNFTVSRISQKNISKMRLYQKETYISIDFLNEKTATIELKAAEKNNGLFNFETASTRDQKNVVIKNLPVQKINIIRTGLESFIGSIVYDKPVAVSVIDGYQAMDVAHQILQKIQKNYLV